MSKSAPSTSLDHAALALDVLQQQPVLWDKIPASTGIQRQGVPQLLAEVLRFLHLIALDNQRLTPALLIDQAWHEFILCTRTYGPFCERHFGRMIHHQPGGKQADNNSQFIRTLACYQDHFGPPPAVYWQPQADCGACRANPT